MSEKKNIPLLGRLSLLIMGVGFLVASVLLFMSLVMSEPGNQTSNSDFCRENQEYFHSFSDCINTSYEEAIDTVCAANPSYNYTFTFDGGAHKTVGCREIKENGYEKIVVRKNYYSLVMYGNDKIYVKYSKDDIVAGKETGNYCMIGDEMFGFVNTNRCINVMIEETKCDEDECLIESNVSGKKVVIIFSEYNSKMSKIFAKRYEMGSRRNIYGRIMSKDNGISIRVDSEKEQVTMGQAPMGGDGSFYVREDY